jgi:hypothetical protein
MAVIRVEADFHRSPFGMWTSTLTVYPPELLAAGGEQPHVDTTPGCSSAAECFGLVMGRVDEYAEHFDVVTVHSLDGDTAAWALLAVREGFASADDVMMAPPSSPPRRRR